MAHERIAYGVDLGGTVIKAGLVDESWHVLWRAKITTRQEEGPRAVLDDVAQLLTGARKESNIPPEKVEGVGLGLPGLVDAERGMAGEAVNLPGWEGFPVCDYLRDRLGIDSLLDHDLRVFTRGEMLCGAARGVRNFALATIGTGVGICIVIDGKIHRQSTGDMGHMTIDYRGRKCACGGAGCLESYVSVSALQEEIKDALQEGKVDRMISPMELAERARGGEVWAKEIFDRAGRFLGLGMLNVAAIINPEVFIIGGGLAYAGELLLEPAIEVLEKHAFMFAGPRERIRMAQLGDDAGIIGAASLILNREE